MNCSTPIDLVGFFAGHPECADLLGQAVVPHDIAWPLYAKAFWITLALELPIYLFLTRRNAAIRKRFAVGVAGNVATHPAVWFLWPWLLSKADANYGTYLLICEAFAPAIEAAILRFGLRIPTGKAVSISVIANLVSWWVGAYLL